MTRKIIDRKACSRCGEVKELNEYYSSEKERSSGEKYTYYHPECKVCTTKRSRKWYVDNPEAANDSVKKYKGSDKGKLNVRKGSTKNRTSGNYKKWQNNNKDKIKKYNQNYSNKKHKISKEEWIYCKEYFNSSCAYCGMTETNHKKIYRQQLHKEHVIHEGRADIKNCVPSCKVCNSSKHIYTLNQWYNKSNPNYTRERYLSIYNWIKYDCKQHK